MIQFVLLGLGSICRWKPLTNQTLLNEKLASPPIHNLQQRFTDYFCVLTPHMPDDRSSDSKCWTQETISMSCTAGKQCIFIIIKELKIALIGIIFQTFFNACII